MWYKFSDNFPCNINFKVWVSINSTAFSWGFGKTSGIKVVVEGRSTIFTGTLSMVIADNLAAHALGGSFCNLSTVNHFCRYCDFSKVMLSNDFKSTEFVMRNGYHNNVSIIEYDPDSASVYGLKSISCLNWLTYFHVIYELPTDLDHDAFEGVAVDVIFHVLINFVNKGVLTVNEINNTTINFTFSQIDLKNTNQFCLKKFHLKISKSNKQPVRCGI